MKKLLGISLVAALAISPLMASAEDLTPQEACEAVVGQVWNTTTQKCEIAKADTYQTAAILPGGQTNDAQNADNVPVAAQSALYAGKVITTADAEHVATGAYVKGAYNAAIAAINKTATDLKEGIVNTVESGSVEVIKGITVDGVAGVSAYTDWADETAIETLGGGAATVSITKGRENVVITQEADNNALTDATVAGRYHQSTQEHPDVLTDQETYSDAETSPFVYQNGETGIVPVTPAP